jgi:hypothetical protein
MSHTLASTSPTGALRRWWTQVWGETESRSIVIGMAGAVLVHLLLWLLAPRILRFEPGVAGVGPQDAARNFNIELAPDSFVKPQAKEQDPFKFVETNPDAPENTPDKTTNFAAQNQQVAQPVATPEGKSDRPAMEGKQDFESTQIVSGRLSDPIERMEAIAPPPLDIPPAETPVAAPKAEQIPLSGVEKFEGENKDGIGGNLAKRLDNATSVPERIEGARDVPDYEGATASQFTIDPRRPRPRPQIVQQPQVRPAILAENKFGTTNIGNIAVDARWSNYGAYLQRMIDIVQIQWERIIIEQRANSAIGTVTVKFVLDADGRIAQIVDVDGTANETASRACVSAITDRAPYGPWTDDMRAILGDRQEMRFTFYYQ